MTSTWQHPYVNLFKHCGVGQWKKCSKEGDVVAVMDRDIKATVYRISGSIPAGNYLQLPKTSSQSLSLTGRYLYLIFRPLPSRYFVVHLEVATETGLAVRISFSNLFKEFKSTSTWLQFPLVTAPGKENAGIVEHGKCVPNPSPESTRWTLLVLDLISLLSTYLRARYGHVKNMKLCANLLVRNVFTSDIEYSPLVGSNPLPREMAFPVAKGQEFSQLYDYIRFPVDMGGARSVVPALHKELQGVQSSVVQGVQSSGVQSSVVYPDSSHHPESSRHEERSRKANTKSQFMPSTAASEGEVHVYMDQGSEVTFHHEEKVATESVPSRRSVTLKINKPRKPQFQSLEPDPILRLQSVIGYGGGQVLFTDDGGSVVYLCHSLLVVLEITSRRQRFFIGHTDKVSCLSMNHDGSLLASGQTGPLSVVRVWRFENGQCLALFKTHSQGLHTLSFSYSGSVLCGVGKDSHGKGLVVLWNTSQVARSGEVTVLTKAHTDASVERMRIAAFDDSRMLSCGWDNIRFWRVRGGSLRSCPVNLEEHHQMHFTDVVFEAGYRNETDFTDRNVYACTKNGYLFEIHYKRIAVTRVWHLLPQGVAINALCVHEAFCVTGSEDGYIRLWPLDFTAAFLEAEHEGAVAAVDVSGDGLKVLTGTSSVRGNIGILDAGSKSYTTVMRSHTGRVQCMSLSGSGKELVTCSSDHTIRVWDLKAMEQLYHFQAQEEVTSCICHHPSQQVFACGFQSGTVRVFHTPSTALLAEHRQDHGSVTGLIFSPMGHRLYSSSSSGSLAMYDTEHQNCRILRLLGNTVARGNHFGPHALSLSEGGKKLAFIGPLEFTITILDAFTLEELLHLDITPMTPSSHSVDPARRVYFAPAAINQLVVVTVGARLLKFSASTGQLLSEVSHIHRGDCTALSLSKDGRHLLTAGDKVVKVWDYRMALDLNFQVFIGHSEPISQVDFTPDGQHVISCGDDIFIWDFMASRGHPSPPTTPPSTPPRHATLRLTSPRRKAPAPADYEPLKVHSFTPLAHTPVHPNKGECLSVDDDCLYQGEGEGLPESSGNINCYRQRMLREESTSGDGESDSGSDHEERQPFQEGARLSQEGTQPSQEGARPSQEGTRPSLGAVPCKEPTSLKHYRCSPPMASLAAHLYVSPEGQAGMRRKAVLGLSGSGRNNLIWQPATGLFAYSSGCIVVVEDLSSGKQRHFTGHCEMVSTLSAGHGGHVLASASVACDPTPCEIRVWKTKSGRCTKVLTFHRYAVSCMAYSRDDRFLLSVGTFQESILALWSAGDYSLLSATHLAHAVHEVDWDPFTAYEFASVGGELCFWLLEEEEGKTYTMKVHEPPVPSEIPNQNEALEFTSLCYGHDSTLFVGTNTGLVTVWDTRANKCVMCWKAEACEIGTVFSSANKVVTGTTSKKLQLWSVSTGTSPPTVAMETSLDLDGGVFSAAFDGKMELGVVGTCSGSVWYINWPEKSNVKLVSGHADQVSGVSFSVGGAQFATCSLDGFLAVWCVETMEQSVLFQAPRKVCTCTAFSTVCNEQGYPGQLVAGYSDGTLRVFDVGRLNMVQKLQPHSVPVKVVRYSTDGLVISGCSNGLVAISNPFTGVVIRVIADHRGAPITDLDTSNKPANSSNAGLDDCRPWLVASGDRRVSVWGGCQLIDWLTLPGPAFAPDGTKLKKGHKCQYELLPPSLARFSPSDADIILYTGYGLEKACCEADGL